ncbi:NAD(P)H-hydrate dehydratase [Nitrosophilus alvini]|uniref:NAD(P)H-hydrate dehydratase n=1 Tax=Nitrosophilus alvini TaxID=2714855 RepID=UPI00190E2C88|nr:NAD(P)H-hydrate dehydratase [Nitrosophilus alvini]
MQNLYEKVDFLDRKCYDAYLLPEDILMEQAAEAMNSFIRANFAKNSKVLIVSGPGNNGADGITLARQLLGDYEVFLFLPFGAKSQMALLQLERFEAVGGKESETIQEADVIVDAMFGAGLTKPLNEKAIEIIEKLNAMKGFKIACDIPTGIDKNGNLLPTAFKADRTITMGALKLALYSDFAKDYVGEIDVADLGVSRTLYEEPSFYRVLETDDFRPPVREKLSSNKGDYGHLAVIAGEKEGAAIMAALSALNFGAGLVTVVSNEKIAVPYELMHANSLPKTTTSIAVGMGLGCEYSDDEFETLILKNDFPLVIDADLFYSKKILSILKREKIVLTPHPKEFASLLKISGICETDAKEVQKRRFELVLKFCEKFPNAVLVLKGANVIVAKGAELFVNPYGSNALSKGGSGDVLTGLIGALLAQGYDSLDAAIQGTLAHSFAAKKVKKANFALTPKDLIEAVGCL